MNIKIKKNLIIFYETHEWSQVSQQIKQDYGDNIFLISWRLRRQLGFTVRHHRCLRKYEGADLIDYNKGTISVIDPDLEHRYYYCIEIHLDFWNEAQMSWFVLKYLNSTAVDR